MFRLRRVVLTGLLLVGAAHSPPPSQAICTTPPADIDGSGLPSVADVQCAIILALWDLASDPAEPAPGCVLTVERGDLDCDDSVTIADVQLAISVVLSVPRHGGAR